ncbi:MAG: glycosyltransferase family 29 protein [Candidatus Bathyarchaeia archaeon]|jgi:hypothetical protein
MKFERPELRAIVQGQHIAIVGSAASILGTGQGDIIDAHDIVIRINLRFPAPDEYADVGKKVDFFYAGDVLTGLGIKNGDIYNGVVTFDKNRKFGKRGKKLWHPLKINSHYNQSPVAYNNTVVNLYPTTGQMAIYDCLMHGATAVYLYGFDCWKTNDRYHPQATNRTDAWHYIETKRMRIIIMDPDYNVIPDATLLKIVTDSE